MPCIICNSNSFGDGLCSACKKDFKKKIHNGKWCKGHKIIHWDDEECPVCKLTDFLEGMYD